MVSIGDRVAGLANPAGTRVPVAAHRLEPGERIEPRDLRFGDPPPGGAEALVDPTGRVVTSPILEGEPIPKARVAPEGIEGVAALLPPGTRAVALPRAGLPPLRIGDSVEVVGWLPAAGSAFEGERPLITSDGSFTATGATVVDLGEEEVTIAVPGADAARVAIAATQGVVTVVVAPPE